MKNSPLSAKPMELMKPLTQLPSRRRLLLMQSYITVRSTNNLFSLTTIGLQANTTNLDLKLEPTDTKSSKTQRPQSLTSLTKRSSSKHSMDFLNKTSFPTQPPLSPALMTPLPISLSFSWEKFSKRLPKAQFLIF